MPDGAAQESALQMRETKGVDFDILPVPLLQSGEGKKPLAIASTGRDGRFIVFFAAHGFRYLDLGEGQWEDAMKFTGSISPDFGLFYYSCGDSNWISFVESPAKSFVSYLMSEEQVAGRMSLRGDVMAACPAGEGIAGMVLSTGQLRFADLTTGQACGKGARPKFLDLEDTQRTFCMAQVKPGQVIVMRQAKAVNGLNVQFFVVELDEMNNAQIQHSGILKMGSLTKGLGGESELESISVGNNGRIIVAWKKAALTNGLLNGKHSPHSPGRRFASVNLQSMRAEALGAELSESSSFDWHTVGAGYFVEWFLDGDDLTFKLRDSKFGLLVATGTVPEAAGTARKQSGLGRLLCTSERYSLASVEGSFVAVRWTLPLFHLTRMIGQAAPTDSPPFNSGEAFSRKRKHEIGEGEVHSSFVASLIRNCKGLPSDVQLLRSCLKPEDLPFVLKTLTSWLAFRRDLTAESIKNAAPGMPSVAAMARFLKALADAFLPSLVKLPADTLQKVS